jgi:benzoyl-CoA 2,3-dioxygenase component B
VPLRNAMNEVTRGAYVRDCEIGVKRWNRLIAKAGYAFELKLPSPHFRRSIGLWAGVPTDPAGRIVPAAEWQRSSPGWVPSEADHAFVKSLMQRVVEPGRMAAWIAPPDRGINNLPVEYEYVHLH